RDERDVDDDDVDRAGELRGREIPRVAPLDDDHARIISQPPVELTVTDVERDDPAGAALQQHVGEAAGGGADVERLSPLDGNAKGVERVRQLHAAAADIRMVRLYQLNRRVVCHLGAGLRDDDAV